MSRAEPYLWGVLPHGTLTLVWGSPTEISKEKVSCKGKKRRSSLRQSELHYPPILCPYDLELPGVITGQRTTEAQR
jgi:hypothetical protein